MKTKPTILAAGIVLAALANGFGATRYVNVNSTSPTPPFTNWATAATIIQDAVDVAVAGDEIVVTNGVYQTGGRAVVGTMTNRVAVDKPLTVRSVNGPEATVIDGGGAERCVFLAEAAALVGFTLTNGFALDGGGGVWCVSTSAVLANCTLTRNVAYHYNGGGALGGTLNSCTLIGNAAPGKLGCGGGASSSMLNNCTLTGNTAGNGGGACSSTLNNCTVSSNSNQGLCANLCLGGGGAIWSTLNNCTLTGNSSYYGGGASQCTLNNCELSGNWARSDHYGAGGGAAGGVLNNCTLVGNSATRQGGGVYQATLNNCIVYYNSAPDGPNYSGGVFYYCCTAPMPTAGVGSITTEPQLTDLAHVSAGSPCRAAGSAAYSNGVDIDGEEWANPPSIGCDEFYAGAASGPLSVAIAASYTNVATGFTVDLAAMVVGHASANRWEFDDGTIVSNRLFYVSHSWSTAGEYAVVFRAYNDSNPASVSATVTVQVVSQPVHYVATDSGGAVSPFTSWATAATNIQEAVDAATVVGALVLVTNGIYQTGGRAVYGTLSNRVAVTKPLTVESVNGPEVTAIRGYQVPDTVTGDGAVRCVYLTNGAALVGFTLTNGATQYEGGGGVWCESASAVVSNCVLSGNAAHSGGGGASGGTLINCLLRDNSAQDYGQGGGAFYATLINCMLSGNLAGNGGGGAYGGTLNNCTLSGNSAQDHGGGVAYSTVNNCIVYFNTAPNGANYYQDQYDGILNYCCTIPLPTNGVGNFTRTPLFVNQAGGNMRLQSNSPCINSGLNAYAPAGFDLDGNPRIAGGTVDVGAYEFQSPQSAISYAWLQGFGLPTDGWADFTDADGDGLNNWQEWRCLTDPTNALSVLRLLSASRAGTDLTVRWESVAGVGYFLERTASLGAQPAFGTLASNIVGQAGTTTYVDTNAVGASQWFYRVGVLP